MTVSIVSMCLWVQWAVFDCHTGPFVQVSTLLAWRNHVWIITDQITLLPIRFFSISCLFGTFLCNSEKVRVDTVSLEVGLWAAKALCNVGCVSPLLAESEGRYCVSVVIYQQSGWCHSLCHYVHKCHVCVNVWHWQWYKCSYLRMYVHRPLSSSVAWAPLQLSVNTVIQVLTGVVRRYELLV